MLCLQIFCSLLLFVTHRFPLNPLVRQLRQRFLLSGSSQQITNKITIKIKSTTTEATGTKHSCRFWQTSKQEERKGEKE